MLEDGHEEEKTNDEAKSMFVSFAVEAEAENDDSPAEPHS
jgi:hypothetical protein